MVGWHEGVEHFWVGFEVLVEALVLLCPLHVELIVDLGGETRHERLLKGSKEVESLDGCVDNLLLSLGVFLGENPWGTVLVVSVTLARIVHGKLESILELDVLHQGHILVE